MLSKCVKTIWRDVKLLIWDSFAGGPSMYCVRWSNDAATVHADITADHRDVPASMFISSFLDGMWLTQEPPCRFQTTWFHFLHSPHNFRNLSAFYCFSGPLSDLLLSGFKGLFYESQLSHKAKLLIANDVRIGGLGGVAQNMDNFETIMHLIGVASILRLMY